MRSIIVSLVALGFSFAPMATFAQVRLSIRTDSADYAVREPIKISVQMTNATPDTVRVFPINELGNHMKHMFIEVTRPDGVVEWRKFLVFFYIEARGVGPVGEPLSPGEMLNLSLYPYMTYLVGPPPIESERLAARFTFDRPGTFHVRVAYYVEDECRYLWKPEGGILYSNSIELHLRESTPAERDVLDAVWSGERFTMLCGDEATHLKGDVQKLRAVIAKYGEDPMIRYAKLSLGRTLAYQTDRASASEGIALLQGMSEQFPGFRAKEILFHRANALDLMGETPAALQLYDAALDQFPALIDDYVFMTRKLWAETHEASVHERYLKERTVGRKLKSTTKEFRE